MRRTAFGATTRSCRSWASVHKSNVKKWRRKSGARNPLLLLVCVYGGGYLGWVRVRCDFFFHIELGDLRVSGQAFRLILSNLIGLVICMYIFCLSQYRISPPGDILLWEKICHIKYHILPIQDIPLCRYRIFPKYAISEIQDIKSSLLRLYPLWEIKFFLVYTHWAFIRVVYSEKQFPQCFSENFSRI